MEEEGVGNGMAVILSVKPVQSCNLLKLSCVVNEESKVFNLPLLITIFSQASSG